MTKSPNPEEVDRFYEEGGVIRGFGHVPVVGPKTVRTFPRPTSRLLERFRRAFVPDVCDGVGQLYTMDPSIRPLYEPAPPVVGSALTVKAPPGDNLVIHGALQMVQPGDVLVVDWRGTDAAGSGAGSLIVPIRHGLVGVVIDGGWRDITELQGIEFPVYGRSVSPFSPPKARPGEINVPIACGGVVVHPGDIVVGDAEGVAIVPLEWAEAVAASLREYQPYTTMDAWADRDEELTSEFAKRRPIYERVFRDRGGITVD